MSLPCFCYKCARYKTLQTLSNEWCLAMERENCGERFCHNCDLTCEHFVKVMPEYEQVENPYLSGEYQSEQDDVF